MNVRIALNGRFYAARPTGVQRFAREIASRLAQRADVLVLAPRGVSPFPLPASRWGDGGTGDAGRVGGWLGGHLWEQLELPWRARRLGCDVALHLANTAPLWGGPHVMVIHDVTPLTHPEWYAPPFARWYRIAMRGAARRAARVLTVSRWSRDEIVRVLGVARERIGIVSQGVAPFDRPAAPDVVAATLARYGLAPGYVLALGGGDARKNVSFLLEVVAEWRHRGGTPPDLVVVGEGYPRVHTRAGTPNPHSALRTPQLVQSAIRNPQRDAVRWLGHVPDAELHALYSAAGVFCFPSAAEGLGRPPLEAMACGTPVIAADYGPAREVLGDAAVILPRAVEAWIAAIESLLADSAERRRTVEAGGAKAAQLSWEEAADAVLAACREAAGAPRRTGRNLRSTAHRGAHAAHVRGGRGRVALVHDWLTGMRGGERVLEALVELYPDCEIFTLVHVPGSTSATIEGRPIHASFLSRLPGVARYYRLLLPFFPLAIARFDLSAFDLVISVSHCVAKGVRPPPGVPHLCYCLTPMRYVWDQYESYFGQGRASWPVRLAARLVVPWLRRWDVRTAARVDRFVACSRHVQERIRRIYGREATVVYPPVSVERFRAAGGAGRVAGAGVADAADAASVQRAASGAQREDFYLTVSALVPYKRVDVLIEAFNRLGLPLVVVGEGSEYRRLRRLAGPTITLTGRLSDEAVADLMRRCRAFVYAAEEDFGIVLAEAHAAGALVIAYGVGGAAEVVGDGAEPPGGAPPWGILFQSQEPEAVIRCVERFKRLPAGRKPTVGDVSRFGRVEFERGIEAVVASLRPSLALAPHVITPGRGSPGPPS